MGLDMYARTMQARPDKPVDFVLPDEDDGEQLHYWRKHPDLHGWMEALYRKKGGTDEAFNCVPVLLEKDDLDALELAVRTYSLPKTEGFFFGASSPDDFSDDLEFIERAREAIAAGKHVFYTSWW